MTTPHPVAGGAHVLSTRDVLVSAALFGTLGGLLEAIYLTIRQVATGLVASGWHLELLWMAPAAGAVTFIAIAAVLSAAAACLGKRIGLSTATWVFAFLSIHGVMQSPGIPLYWQAEVVASLGVAAVVTRWVGARAARASALLRRAPAHLAGAWAILLAFALVRLPATAERRALADLPAAPAGLPNVLLIILDTVRAANLGLYGYDRPTSPELSRWAEGGVVFERAYSTAPWTLPAHATLFTGRYPYETGTGIVRPLGPQAPTLAETLASHGYTTGGFVANLLYATPTSGLDRGFARYEAHGRSPAEVARSYWLPRAIESAVRKRRGLSTTIAKDGRRVTDDFLAWVDRRGDRPFFAFLNYFDAHDPYEPPEPWRTLFGPGPGEPWRPQMVNLRGRTDSFAQDLIDGFVERYDGGIAYADHQLGVVRRHLEAAGLLDETIVVITADHGEAWGENGQMGHLNALYVPLLHVPLLISYPGNVPERIRVDGPVTLRDLPATILDLAGLLGDGALPGTSLAPGMREGVVASPSHVLAELHAYQRESKAALFESDLHYIDFGDGNEELYDLGSDPTEEHDLSSEASHADALAGFRATLRSLGATPGPRMLDAAERRPR